MKAKLADITEQIIQDKNEFEIKVVAKTDEKAHQGKITQGETLVAEFTIKNVELLKLRNANILKEQKMNENQNIYFGKFSEQKETGNPNT